MIVQLYKTVRRPDTVNIFNGGELLSTIDIDTPLGFNPLSPQWGRVESSNIPEGANAVKYSFNGLPYVAEVNVTYSGRGDLYTITGEVNAAATLYEYNSLSGLRAMIDRTSAPQLRLGISPPAAVTTQGCSIRDEYSEGWWDGDPAVATASADVYVMFELWSPYLPPHTYVYNEERFNSYATLTPYNTVYVTTLSTFNSIVDSIIESVSTYNAYLYNYIASLFRGVWILPYFNTNNLYRDYANNIVDFRFLDIDNARLLFTGLAGESFPSNLNPITSAVQLMGDVIDTNVTLYQVTGGNRDQRAAIPVYRNFYRTFTAHTDDGDTSAMTISLALGDSWEVTVPFSALLTTPPWYTDNTADRRYTAGMQLVYDFNSHCITVVPLFSWGVTDSPSPYYHLSQSFSMPYVDRNIFESLCGYESKGLDDLTKVLSGYTSVFSGASANNLVTGVSGGLAGVAGLLKTATELTPVNTTSAAKSTGTGLDYVLGNPNLRIIISTPRRYPYSDSTSGELLGYTSSSCIEGGISELPYGYYKLLRASLSNSGGYPISLIRQAEKQLEQGFWYQL